MSSPNAAIHVNVDVTNPGQFFACCGLLELADRLWPGATGWFDADQFRISCDGTLPELISQLSQSRLTQVDPESNTSSPIRIEAPFHLLLDWWHDRRSGGRELKVWAGTMESVRIAKAMQAALKNPVFQSEDLLNEGTVTYDVENPSKKVEPYYFDARRGPNAHSRDVGFSSNALGLTTTAAPAVELLCLIGLQRSRPALTNQPRIFRYFTWNRPVSPPVLPLVVNGLSHAIRAQGFQFENWYRTGQKKNKAFLPATPLNEMR